MSMKAVARQVGSVTVLDLSGSIKLGEGSSLLRDAVKDLLAKGQKNILLNLGDISYIDSSGIGELVSAFTSVRNQGGELKLLHLTKKMHDLLQITKLYTVFDVKDDEAEAISAFGRGSADSPVRSGHSSASTPAAPTCRWSQVEGPVIALAAACIRV